MKFEFDFCSAKSSWCSQWTSK